MTYTHSGKECGTTDIICIITSKNGIPHLTGGQRSGDTIDATCPTLMTCEVSDFMARPVLYLAASPFVGRWSYKGDENAAC
jgi:hypothetical protein